MGWWLFFFISVSIYAQDTPLTPFGKLVGGHWVAEGTWSNGASVRWMTTFEWGLNGKIVKVKHYGDDWNDRGEFGLRNEGIRAWDAEQKKVRFWEFDVLGGIVTGDVIVDKDTIHYEYEYPVGEKPTRLRESWYRRDADTYDFRISALRDKIWTVMLHTVYKRHF
jgi:hypothetical protein